MLQRSGMSIVSMAAVVGLTSQIPATELTTMLQVAGMASVEADTPQRVVASFATPPDETRFAELEGAGVRLLRVMGGSVFLLEIDDERALIQAGGTLLASIEGSAKLSRHFVGDQPPAWAVTQQLSDGVELLATNILVDPQVDLMEAADQLHESAGAILVSPVRSIHALVVLQPIDRIDALVRSQAVLAIEPALPPLGETNAENRELTQAEVVHDAPYNLDGAGVNVMLYDGGGADADHLDFGGRLTIRDGSGVFDHATHVGGTIGGNGAESGGLHRGMAPAATIDSFGFFFKIPEPPMIEDLLDIFFANPGDIEADYLDAATNYGSSVANNSIGLNLQILTIPGSCELYGAYGLAAATIDSLARGDIGPPMIICWAAGNIRSVEPNGFCGVEYGSISPPSNNKNAILVGAVDSDTDLITDFSSFGPTRDGRLKPDVAAPGCQVGGDEGVTSLAVGSGYLTACGTSMATPTVTGLVALLLQDYRQMNPGAEDFRNSTAKAVLAQTAVDIEAPGPDYRSGYGSVRVADAIDLMRDQRFHEDTVDDGQAYSFSIDVPEGELEFKITLAWDDPPAAPDIVELPEIISKLINDLDLVVLDPSGAQHLPWTLDPENPDLPAVKTAEDHLNNIEQVQVANPPAGEWMIEVRGTAVPVGPQLFSLAFSSAADEVLNPADVNGDGSVNTQDLVAIILAWGPCVAPRPEDIDNNGFVDVADLTLVILNWSP